MPIRTYTISALTGVTPFNEPGGTWLPLLSGNNNYKGDKLYSSNFGSGSGGSSGGGGFGNISFEGATVQNISGIINYAQFPTIPSTAVITKVKLKGSYRFVITASADYGPNVPSFNASVDVTGSGRCVCGDLEFGFSDEDTDVAEAPVEASLVLADNNASDEHDYSAVPITYAAFIALYDDITINDPGTTAPPNLNAIAIPFGVNRSGSIYFSAIVAFDSLEVTWDLASYSWYIKPEIKVINGKAVKVIDPINGIIGLVTAPPADSGYEFYGTSVDYPVSPLFLWWQTSDLYQTYIYSPIDPTIVYIPGSIFPGTFVNGVFVPGTFTPGQFIPNYVPGTEWILVPPGGTIAPLFAGSASITLGALTVLLADASGIYQIISNKTNDTMYERAIAGTTTDVKIPDPLVKIGFVP